MYYNEILVSIMQKDAKFYTSLQLTTGLVLLSKPNLTGVQVMTRWGTFFEGISGSCRPRRYH